MSNRERVALAAIVGAGLLVRLSLWTHVFVDGQVFLDGPDGYYHLRRALLSWQHWPFVPQFDALLNWPKGGIISWPPLFDGLLATLALPWRTSYALERIGALLPPALGALQLLALFAVGRAARGVRAGLVAAGVAAVLPGVVRYTFLGVLDHDPFFSLALILSILALCAGEMREHWRVILLTASLVMGILGWTGATVQFVIVAAAGLATLDRKSGRVLSLASMAAAVVLLPFVATSVWRTPTFEGLSLLHVATLAASALAGALLSRSRTLIVLNLLAVVATAPFCVVPFLAGIRYAAGDAAILGMVGEAQPLLRLFGAFDLRPMFVRLGLLPLFAFVFLPRWIADRGGRVIGTWVAITFVLALLHSRFSYDAALAMSCFAGLAFDDLLQSAPRRAVMLAGLLAIAPAAAAYVPIPGFESFNFFTRGNMLRGMELDGIAASLRRFPRGAVLGSPFIGHWILWYSGDPVVLSPMMSVGQSGFERGMHWFFIEDPAEARRYLLVNRVRYVVVSPELDSIGPRARAGGFDASRFLRDDDVVLSEYMRTVAAHLSFWGVGGARAFGRDYPPLQGYREIMQSHNSVPGPFGRVPIVRVFEVAP